MTDFHTGDKSSIALSEQRALIVWFEADKVEVAIESARKYLSAEEKERAGRFRTIELQHRFILNRAFLRDVLAYYLNCSAQAIDFTYGEREKPLAFATPHGMLHFNLTHSGNLTLCALILNRQIGLDFEHMREMKDMHELASRFFSPQEAARLASLPPADQIRGFFQIWTAKEGFIKATGEGLSRPLNSFSIDFGNHPQLHIRWNVDNSPSVIRWKLEQFESFPDYIGAVCVEGNSDFACEFVRWSRLT